MFGLERLVQEVGKKNKFVIPTDIQRIRISYSYKENVPHTNTSNHV